MDNWISRKSGYPVIWISRFSGHPVIQFIQLSISSFLSNWIMDIQYFWIWIIFHHQAKIQCLYISSRRMKRLKSKLSRRISFGILIPRCSNRYRSKALVHSYRSVPVRASGDQYYERYASRKFMLEPRPNSAG